MKKFKILDEFKAFALKGNMVDLAIGVIIGTSFNKVISSLVSDIIMPPIGLLIGGVDFSELKVQMKIPGSTSAPVSWNIGAFLSILIDFFIIAWVVFLAVKLMNKLRGAHPENKLCDQCLMSIPPHAKKCRYCASPQQ